MRSNIQMSRAPVSCSIFSAPDRLMVRMEHCYADEGRFVTLAVGAEKSNWESTASFFPTAGQQGRVMLTSIRRAKRDVVKGKYALITGSYRGIGRAIALKFGQHAARKDPVINALLPSRHYRFPPLCESQNMPDPAGPARRKK